MAKNWQKTSDNFIFSILTSISLEYRDFPFFINSEIVSQCISIKDISLLLSRSMAVGNQIYCGVPISFAFSRESSQVTPFARRTPSSLTTTVRILALTGVLFPAGANPPVSSIT